MFRFVICELTMSAVVRRCIYEVAAHRVLGGNRD